MTPPSSQWRLSALVGHGLLLLFSELLIRCFGGVGWLMGWLVYASSKRYRAMFKQHFFQAFPQQKLLAWRAVGQLGRMLGHNLAVWCLPASVCLALTQVSSKLLLGPQQLLVLAPHLGCFEWVGWWLCQHRRFVIMYRPAKWALVEKLQRRARQRGQAVLVTADASGLRQLMRAVQAGDSVGILPDQVPAHGAGGSWVQWFDRAAYAPELAAQLSLRYPLEPVLVVALRRRFGFELLAQPVAWQGDSAERTADLVALMQHWVRRYPLVYLWSYNRYKVPVGSAPAGSRFSSTSMGGPGQ